VSESPDRWSNYEVVSSGCWEWRGYADPNGYARIYDPERPQGQRVQWAHRAFYERHVGPIPAGMEIDHTCCNTICVNPAHLEPVTRPEHIRRTFMRLGIDDKHARAAELRMLRMTYAEIADVLGYRGRNGAADAVKSAISKGLAVPDVLPTSPGLTESERQDIRDLHKFGIPQIELAAWYRVDSSHISRICKRSREAA